VRLSWRQSLGRHLIREDLASAAVNHSYSSIHSLRWAARPERRDVIWS